MRNLYFAMALLFIGLSSALAQEPHDAGNTQFQPLEMRVKIGTHCEYDYVNHKPLNETEDCFSGTDGSLEAGSIVVKLDPNSDENGSWEFKGLIEGREVKVSVSANILHNKGSDAISLFMHFLDVNGPIGQRSKQQIAYFRQDPHGVKLYFYGPEIKTPERNFRYVMTVDFK